MNYLLNLKDLFYQERNENINLPKVWYRRLRADMIETYKLMSRKYDAKVNTFMPKAKENKYVFPLKDTVRSYFFKDVNRK